MKRSRSYVKNPGVFGRAFRAAAFAGVLACANAARAEHSIFDDDWTPPNTEVPKKTPAHPADMPGTSSKPGGTTDPLAGSTPKATAPAAPLPSESTPGPASAEGPASAGSKAPRSASPHPKEPAVEPDPKAEYAKIFGAREKAVLATPGTKDDAALGMELVDLAHRATDTPKLQALLYEKAADLAAKDPSGYAVALQALDALRQLEPAQAPALDSKYLVVCLKQYLAAAPADKRPLADPYRSKLMQVATARAAAGNYEEAISLCKKAADVARTLGPDEAAEVAAFSKQVSERQLLAKRATELKQKLAAGAADPASAKELVGLLAAALDQPAQATAYLSGAADPGLSRCVSLAAAPPGDLTEEQVLQLGDWYKSVAGKVEKTAPSVAASLLQRAGGAFNRFLSMHAAQDSLRLRATVAMTDIGKELERIGRPAEQTSFLLSRVIPQRHQVSGHWEMGQSALIGDANVSAHGATLVIPVMPQGNYEISIEFESDGASDVGFTLPVGTSSVSVLWEWRSAGLFFVNGTVDWLAQNKLPMLTMDHNQHVLYAKVLTRGDEAGVLVSVDGVEAGRWEGALDDLNTGTAFSSPDPKLPALNLWSGRVAFYSASLHMLSGTVSRVEVDMSKQAAANSGGTTAVGRGRVVTGGAARSSAMPADGSRPQDGVLNGSFLYHDLASLTFSKTDDQRTVNIEFTAPSDETGFVLRGLPALVADPYNLQGLRLTQREYQRLVALSKETPSGYTDEQAAKLIKLYDAWFSAAKSDKPAAEHALFVAVHDLGEGYRKLAQAWVDYVRQNTSDEEYQAVLKNGRFGMSP